MKITKYEHACIVLEEQGKRLVIDPGDFTPHFGNLENIEALVITHVHADHFDPQHVKSIIAANPEVHIYTVQEVAEQLRSQNIAQNVTLAQPGERVQSETFVLEFWGEMHQLIHELAPLPHNTGVLVNDVFFYPGDSFTLPDKPVKVLAVPGSAPWMTVGMAMDYILATEAEHYIPTHDALLSENGHNVMNHWLQTAAAKNQAAFSYLKPNESLEV
jgi:L-ascorbate metabolism protein UlaG (beta-lactamase superfamily)